MGHGFPDVELGLDAAGAHGPVQPHRVREQKVARAGLQEGRREALGIIAVDRRQIGVLAVVAAGVDRPEVGHRRGLQEVQLVVDAEAVAEQGPVGAGRHQAERGGPGQALVADAQARGGSQVAAGRAAGDHDVLGGVGLQELAVDRHAVVQRRWEAVERRIAVVDRPGLVAQPPGLRRTLAAAGLAAHVGPAAAVDIDVRLVRIRGGQVPGRGDIDRGAADVGLLHGGVRGLQHHRRQRSEHLRHLIDGRAPRRKVVRIQPGAVASPERRVQIVTRRLADRLGLGDQLGVQLHAAAVDRSVVHLVPPSRTARDRAADRS